MLRLIPDRAEHRIDGARPDPIASRRSLRDNYRNGALIEQLSVVGHSLPDLALNVMSVLAPIAADIPVRQLRAKPEVAV